MGWSTFATFCVGGLCEGRWGNRLDEGGEDMVWMRGVKEDSMVVMELVGKMPREDK